MEKGHRFVHRPFTEVMLRVAYRLVESDYKRRKDLYLPYPPAGVQRLSEDLQTTFPELRPFLQYYARNLAHGYKLRDLRDNPPDYSLRSIAKLKPRQRRRER